MIIKWLNKMHNKSIYFTFTLIIIPIYIFFTPVMNYLENFNKITYSLELPDNKIIQDENYVSDKDSFNIDEDFLLEKKITESWVLIFPELTTIDSKNNFIKQLKSIGISSMVDLKSKGIVVFGIGPFVDKKMAEMISSKVNDSTGKKGLIKRLNN